MALLVSLCAIKPVNPIYCIHVEHGLRPANESRGDADFVKTFCEKNGIDCLVVHIPPGKIEKLARRKGIGIEAAARFFRHKAFKKEAARLGENTLVLTAHTKDDILENTLMRVLRGTGPAGLASMPVRNGKLFRPLLSKTRAEIENYLNEKNINWRDDLTNTDEKFLRNKIRHRLIPLLNEYFPSWKTGVNSMAQTQSLAASFIASEAKDRICWIIKNLPRTNTNQHENEVNRIVINSKPQCNSVSSVVNKLIFTDARDFFAQPLIIREEAVFQAINTLSSLCDLGVCEPKVRASLRESFRDKSIKRSVVRKFCEGKIKAADLGSVRLKLENDKISLSRARKEYFERGISRLIIEPRLDNL
ncbi:MAG: tRNA lysidine(34) synthetase TilS [Treponema sp.]|nr:tRNA lysidine(34) synthetase TilS [Treponema sp.]